MRSQCSHFTRLIFLLKKKIMSMSTAIFFFDSFERKGESGAVEGPIRVVISDCKRTPPVDADPNNFKELVQIYDEILL